MFTKKRIRLMLMETERKGFRDGQSSGASIETEKRERLQASAISRGTLCALEIDSTRQSMPHT